MMCCDGSKVRNTWSFITCTLGCGRSQKVFWRSWCLWGLKSIDGSSLRTSLVASVSALIGPCFHHRIWTFRVSDACWMMYDLSQEVFHQQLCRGCEASHTQQPSFQIVSWSYQACTFHPKDMFHDHFGQQPWNHETSPCQFQANAWNPCCTQDGQVDASVERPCTQSLVHAPGWTPPQDWEDLRWPQKGGNCNCAKCSNRIK